MSSSDDAQRETGDYALKGGAKEQQAKASNPRVV